MTPRERLLSVLNHQKADFVPWFGDLDYWAVSLIKRGLKKEGFIASDDYLKWHEDLGVGFYLQGCFPFKEIFHNCKVTEEDRDGLRSRTIKTPVGTISEVWKWMDDTFSEAPIKHFIETEEDLRIYNYAYKHLDYEPDFTFLEKRNKQIGDLGLLLAYMPKSPLMQMIALDSGISNVVILEMEQNSLFEETIAVMEESLAKACKIVLQSPAEIIMIPENLSAEMVGPKYYEKYVKGYQTKWSDNIKQKGKFSCIHMDGTLKGLFKEVCSVNLSFIEACTPSPVGDLPVKEWENYLGDSDTLFWGGIPGIFFTSYISDDDFSSFIKETLEIMRKKPRYVLGVADQVPPDGLEYRVKMVKELVETYGRYE